MTLSVGKADIEKLLSEGEYHIHAIRPKDMARKRNLELYQLYHLVYDKGHNVVFNFFWCSICKEILNVNLAKNGTNQLKAHPCWNVFMAEKTEQKEETPEENVVVGGPTEPKKKVYFDPGDDGVMNAGLAASVAAGVDNVAAAVDNVAAGVDNVTAGVTDNATVDVAVPSRELLVTTFTQYGNICQQFGALTSSQIEKIMPTTMNMAAW